MVQGGDDMASAIAANPSVGFHCDNTFVFAIAILLAGSMRMEFN